MRSCRRRMEETKKLILKRFWTRLHAVGQFLNAGSRASHAAGGFSLASLDKLVQAKSTFSPKHDVIHFALASLKAESAAEIFREEELFRLATAKALKSFNVYQDCVDLVQGFMAVQAICKTGAYPNLAGAQVKMERRRKTRRFGLDGEAEEEPAIDTDDTFHSNAKAFVDDNEDKVKSIGRGCYAFVFLYKELAIFFNHPSALYPPPKDEKDTKEDIVALLWKWAQQIRIHAAEVEQDNLRQLLAETRALVQETS